MSNFSICSSDWAIRPEVSELLTLSELNELKEWINSFRKANIAREDADMLCIPQRSKELTEAIKRVSLKILKKRAIELSLIEHGKNLKRKRSKWWYLLRQKMQKNIQSYFANQDLRPKN